MESYAAFTLRPAVEKDAPAMMRLIHELALFEKAPLEVTVSIEHFTQSGFGVAPVWWAWVAETTTDYDSKIVGFALYYVRYSTWKGKKMYLEDIVVTEQWRGKGVGSALIKQLINIAAEQNFNGISFQVLDWNENAIGFYKKFGATFDAQWINVNINV